MARRIQVDIVGDSKSLERAFDRSSRAANGFNRDIGRASRGMLAGSGALGKLTRGAGAASAAFLGGAGLVYAFKSVIGEASNLNEEMNKSRVVFGAHGTEMQKWSKTSATSLGLAQSEALGAAGAFGAMFETAGLAEGAAAGMSKRMVQLAADMGSFNNVEPSEMLDNLRSALAGEAEPLRRYGVLLSEARVKTEAYRIGLAKTGKELTEQQKVQARYSLILGDTSRQQGDFGRTSGGLANQMRTLRAAIKNTEAIIGKAFIPTVVNATKALNDWLANPENQRNIEEFANSSARAVSKTAHVVERLNHAGQLTQDVLAQVFLAPVQYFPYFHDKLENARRDMRGLKTDAEQAAISSALAFAAARGGSFAVKAAGRAANATTAAAATIPASVSGTGGRLPGPPGTGTPFLRLLLAQAERTKGRGDDERVLKRIIAVLRARAGATGNLAARTQLVEAINGFAGTLAGLQEQDAQVIKTAAERAKDRAKKAHDAALEALRKLNESIRRQQEIARSFTVPISLQIAAAKATTTKTEKDDRAIAQATKRFAEIAIKSGRLRGQGLIDAYNAIAAANAQMASRVTSAQQDADLSYLAALDRDASRNKQLADAAASGGVVVNVTGTYDGRHGAEAAGHVIARGINRR